MTQIVEFIEPIQEVFHNARHHVASFGEMDEAPVVDAAWNVGVLFGIHLARQYPELVPKVDKILFEDGKLFPSNVAADFLAEAINGHWFATEITDDKIIDAWMKLADGYGKEEVEVVTPEEYWPLPKEWPEEYQGA